MTTALESPTVHRPDARRRAQLAREMMRDCHLCAFHCGVDRTQGPAGFCRSDASPRVFRTRLECIGEGGLVPNLVVNLSGCNMTCDFCITGSSSQNGNAGEPLDLQSLAEEIDRYGTSLRSFKIEGGEPTIHLPAALEIAAIVPRSIKIVWKTNAYASDEALDLLDGIVDVFLVDYKFGNDACARRLAGIPNYIEVVRQNLSWAQTHSTLIVRHLLMPGHFDCCFLPCIDWMAEHTREVPLSLLTGYLPTFRAERHSELTRANRPHEAEHARELVRQRGLQLCEWNQQSSLELPSTHTEDEIWIDRAGRINIPVASAELASCLQRLAGEFSMQS